MATSMALALRLGRMAARVDPALSHVIRTGTCSSLKPHFLPNLEAIQHCRPVGNDQVNMITRHLDCDYVEFMLKRYLPDDVMRANGDLARHHTFALFGNTDQVHLQVGLCLRTELITSHGDRINLHFG